MTIEYLAMSKAIVARSRVSNGPMFSHMVWRIQYW